MKRKKVDVENLPVEEAEHADVKFLNTKKLKSNQVEKEDYEKMLNDPSNHLPLKI